MGENGHQYSIQYWSIDIQDNNLEEVLKPETDCCIYRVPQYLHQINEEAYTPRLISIGPLHHGKFMGMENQKKRFWSGFWEREDNTQEPEGFKVYIKEQEQRIRDHYSVSSTLQSSEYIEMIQRDAVFIIELFMRSYYRKGDFLLKSPIRSSIKEDLLLLENQLLEEKPEVKHFTDLLRYALVMEVQPTKSNGGMIIDLPTATKLNESGLNFSGTKKKFYLDIILVKKKRCCKWLSWFDVNELQIPRIEIYDETEGLFRNMMALELFHYPEQTHICNYVELLDYLIDTVNDVDLLVEKGIIVNCVGDNKVIAKMFNRLYTHMIVSGNSHYHDIVESMKVHYKYPWNHAKAKLRSAYFGNLWTGTATVAATLLLILTVIQTVCSIMQLFV